MKQNIVTLQAADGSTIQFVDEIKASGGMKDVYFSPNKDYVVAFFRDQADAATRERIAMITGTYRDRIFNQAGGEYWKKLFCWPIAMVEYRNRIGVATPFYDSDFFFKLGSRNQDMLQIKGKEKEGKWFASANNRSKFLDPAELGNGMLQLRLCLMIARAVRRMHSAGLAHSDLSYRNVLIDPTSGRACLIDLDGLVVPGKYPPDVVGTPDFIAPECVATAHLDKHDPQRKLPSIVTDRHALAVLIYMYLLFRHPLRGDKVHAADAQEDEEMSMGKHALFIEHPHDASNRIKLANLKASELPWKDTSKLPYQITGPYLSELILKAFTDGLHDPSARPTADEWENALVKTIDLLQPCVNTSCEQKWYVFENKTRAVCPYCQTPYQGKLPVLNFYSSRKDQCYRPDNHRLMVYSNQSLFSWHVNRNIVPNERLADSDKKRVGYFVLHDEVWYLVNEALPELIHVNSKNTIAIGKIALDEGTQLLLSKEEGGRLIIVQMVDN